MIPEFLRISKFQDICGGGLERLASTYSPLGCSLSANLMVLFEGYMARERNIYWVEWVYSDIYPGKNSEAVG